MATYYIVQNDAEQVMDAWLKNADKTAIDLTDATQVHLHVGKAGGGAADTIVDAAATVVSPATAGHVRYTWKGTNTIAAGDYDAEFEIRWPGGVIRTVPSKKPFKVVIGAEVA